MSDPFRGTLSGAIVCVAALVFHSPASAQQRPVPTVAEQRARVQRLAEDLQRADAAFEQARAAITAGATLDTVRDGPLVLLVEPPYRSQAIVDARQARRTLEATYGSAAARLGATPIVFRTARARRDGTDSVTVLAVASGEGLLRPLEGDGPGVIERQLVRIGTVEIRAGMDRELQQWIGSYGPTSARDAAFMSAYEDLATSPSPLGRRCLVGDLSACSEALVLREVEDAMWRWYDATWRRESVRQRRWDLRSESPTRYDACLSGDDAACDALLRSRPNFQPAPPLKYASRQTLAGVALELGGRDAFARLVDERNLPISERLSAAAGISSDSLVAEWRERVLASSPRRAGFTAGTAATTLAWILFFAFLSSRSTRWR